jgi:hypothetical protein
MKKVQNAMLIISFKKIESDFVIVKLKILDVSVIKELHGSWFFKSNKLLIFKTFYITKNVTQVLI